MIADRNHFPDQARRGTTLLVVLILLPLVISLFLVVFTQLDLALRETQRHQSRVQARLLAESALAVLQHRLAAASQGDTPAYELTGSLKDIGDYRIEALEPASSPTRLRAIGEVVDWNKKAICELELEVTRPVASAGGEWQLAVLGTSYQMLAITPPEPSLPPTQVTE